MSQISGAWTAELDLTRLADQLALRLASVLVTEQLADRIATKVAVMLTPAAGGEHVYEREPEPGSGDPGSGARRGARFGGVTDAGTVDYDPGEGAP
ncbi:MAG: hypothetical protein GEV12_13605 [Micromonosporaceae bacterium]|nr:hypothetical protein [Micromonosporaceae bacterium]